MQVGASSLKNRSNRFGILRESLRKSPASGFFGAVPAEFRPGDQVEPDGYSELHRQILAYGQRFDLQTGLLNYPFFQESLGWLLRNRQPGQEFALIWVDLLNLRSEFSLRGPKGPEELVRRLVGSLRSAVEADAVLGRLSGRSFLIAMPSAKLDEAGRRRIQLVVDALEPMRVLSSEIEPEVAAGVAFYPSDTDSAEELVRFASIAAARASDAKSSTVVAFDASMNTLIMRDRKLEVEIQKGLDQGQFKAFYQPKVDLATGQVLGAESLLRWNHPERGPVQPGEFIPIAERSRLIHRIFDLSLRAALKDAQYWREVGFTLPIISVNASATNICREDFARSVQDILAETPIAPTKLEIEVTESVLFDDEDLFAERVRQLKAIGVRIAIDDFGTRYTGFNVLRNLPMDAMKIDQCFVRGIHRSQEMRALCQTIVAMARSLNMHTVAEGIEESGELEVMREIGCNAGQGFLFGRPMPAENFPAFVLDWSQRMRGFGYSASGERNAIALVPKIA